ncbi:hypothetical protein PARHAE_01810 [Paracoccus haematequi]|jgi:hypothetical protein|uniref:Uncharacterized protein n=1 Tax=Paracoccus haematequi TaxID=2491866 RepID=A0A447IMA1_9RHOB|nr:hypothetical protein [Paracoccus haematequi]VDS08626.1 hypothetical protein PARHAE_01810 [Paracoccus haematequi]
MARQDEPGKTPAQPPADKDGVLPDGIRGTTRDTGHTVPEDEHEGFPDPTKPKHKPGSRPSTP